MVTQLGGQPSDSQVPQQWLHPGGRPSGSATPDSCGSQASGALDSTVPGQVWPKQAEIWGAL